MSTEEKPDNLKGEIYEYMDTLSEKIEELTGFVHAEFSTLHEKIHGLELKFEEMNQAMQGAQVQFAAGKMETIEKKVNTIGEQVTDFMDNNAQFQEQVLEKLEELSAASGYEEDENGD